MGRRALLLHLRNTLGCYRIARWSVSVLFLMGWSLWAGDGGSLLGTITDPNGAAVPGAQVTATEKSTAVKQTNITDGRGFYSFQSLPVGSYDVEVRASGFKPLRRNSTI